MDGPSIYRLSVAHVLRVVASAMIGAGILWVVVALTGLTGVARGLLALATALLVVGAAVAFVRPPRVLTLDDAGYRVSLVRGAGVSAAGWREVESVRSGPVRDTPAMVFELTDDRSTVVPLTLLGSRNVAAQREVHERLNTANGYKHLT